MDAIVHSLNFDARVFVYQIILFVLLWVILARLFWNPVLAHLRRREDEIENAYRTVEQTNRDIEALRNDYLARMAAIEAEARGQIQSAIKDAQAERERLLSKAREDAESAIQQGLVSIEQEREQSLSELRSSIVELAVTAVTRALGSAVDPVAIRPGIEERIRHDSANGTGLRKE